MKQHTTWAAWVAAVVILWVAWGWGVYGHIHSRNVRWGAERDGLKVQEAKALGLLAMAPILTGKIDSIKSEFQKVANHFATVGDLQRLPNELADHGYHLGIDQVEVTFDLSSVLEIPAVPTTSKHVLDTLLVQVSARGKFGAIGHWLDDMEQRADFLKWNSCRWQPSEQEGITSFSGMAQFRIITANADEPASDGK